MVLWGKVYEYIDGYGWLAAIGMADGSGLDISWSYPVIDAGQTGL